MGIYGGEPYEVQKAAAQGWAAILRAEGTHPGSTAGWPECWWTAIITQGMKEVKVESEFGGRDLPEGYVMDPLRPANGLEPYEKLRLMYQTGTVDPAATRDGGRAWTGQSDNRNQ